MTKATPNSPVPAASGLLSAPIDPWSPGADKEFDWAKVVFEQNFAQFRHLNDQMNRIPAFAVTLTGGFWYIAVVVANYGHALSPVREHLARFALMIFAGLCDFVLVAIAIRIRDVMADYLERVQRFEGDWWIERKKRSSACFKAYSMISMYSVLLLGGAIVSWVGAFLLFWPSDVLSIWWGVLILCGTLLATFLLAYRIPRWLSL